MIECPICRNEMVIDDLNNEEASHMTVCTKCGCISNINVYQIKPDDLKRSDLSKEEEARIFGSNE